MLAAGFGEFVDPHPAPGNQFGASVVPLATGDVVITSPYDDAGGTDAGAVYLFNGRTGALISTLTGSHADDHVGIGGVTALTNGNFVVASPDWDGDTTQDVGAATWGSGIMGVSGVVSAGNSLVGSTQGDKVAYSSFLSPSKATVAALTNGNYVVFSPQWDNGTIVDAGAATWGDGTSGIHGEVSPFNSLVGSTASDQVGLEGAAKLTNGNYVVISRFWDNGSAADAGAATWGDGTKGVSGAVTDVNSLVGTMKGDKIGIAFALPNGNYVAYSTNWHTFMGAATFGNGTTGISGPVSANNSLVGSTPGDGVGSFRILANGNYVVAWPDWTNGTLQFAGAVTFGDGTAGVRGVVGPDISLIGDATGERVGSSVIVLSNGNYVVASPGWKNGSNASVGAVTFGDGTVGLHGMISMTNSLVGTNADDQVGSGGVTALTNGNYVVASPLWDNSGIADVGAVTWGDGVTGTYGEISSTNSLVGGAAGDQIGGPLGSGGLLALKNGNYVVRSPLWDNGNVQDAGAATFGNGVTGISGLLSTANSLYGTTEGDQVSLSSNGLGPLALANGNYVVTSPKWDDDAIVDVGASTFGNGQTGTVGAVAEDNSLFGSTANDQVGGSGGFSIHSAALTNGNFVLGSPSWDNSGIVDAGAATFGSGTTGILGVVTATNSLVGSSTNDQVADSTLHSVGIQPLSNGNFLVVSSSWDNGALQDAGAVTFGDGVKGLSGPINATNSAIGRTASSNLSDVVLDAVNQSFYVRFLSDGGGRVVVGSQIDGFAHPWHLAAKPTDVTNDGLTAPNDLTAIISYLNGYGASDVPANAQIGKPFGFLDANGDDQVAPNDLTKVISYLNAFGAGEGEAPVQSPKSNVQGQDGRANDFDAVLMLLAMDASEQATRKR
jgi:uncharacterized protein DUF5650/dockerin type I repeat protein